MNFKTKQRWKKGLTALGLIGLGYFIGRPDQLERIARNLNNWAESQPRYIVPATVTTTHQPVLIYRQPVMVNRQPVIVTAQAQSWNQFSDSQARFSVLVPGSVERRAKNSGEQTFSVTTANEFYSIGHQPNFPNSELITDKGKQVMLENAAKTFNPQDFRVVSKRSFGLNGVPGVEFHLQHTESNAPPTIMRQMVLGNSLYTVWVTTPYSQNAQTFLSSFRLH
jgi:hypothetical protein